MYYRSLFIKFLLSFLMTQYAITTYAEDLNYNLIHCLGREEINLHKSQTEGPIYRLNQTLINSLASIGSLYIPKSSYMKICAQRNKSPSVELIKALLVDGKSVLGSLRNLSPIKKITLDSLVEGIPDLFYSYVNGVKAQGPTFDCLTNQIPELEILSTQVKYLEADLPLEKLYSDKKMINTIFNKLAKAPVYYRNCEKNLKKSKAKK